MAVQKKGTSSIQKVAKKSKPSELSDFKNIFTQYANSTTALREFFSQLNPFVAEMTTGIKKQRETYVKETISDFGQRASQEELQELLDFFEGLKDRFTKKTAKPRAFKATEIKSLLVRQFAAKFVRLFFLDAPDDIHRELLNRSILMSLISYFEVLIADLTYAFYRIAPDAALTEDRTLSASELKKFSTIDAALQSVISDVVDDLLRGSVTDWHRFFSTRMKIDMQLLTPDWAQWNEYFQRRHLIVHTGGRVTERYLSNVDWVRLEPRMTKPSLSSKLKVDEVYIEHALNAFEITGLLLCQEAWRKLVLGDSEGRYSALTGLSDAVYRRLLSRHWSVAERLATWGERDPEVSENDMLICKFNRWLCIKRQGRWAEVEEEVKAFDCSAKNRRYALVRASLLERLDEFYELLPELLNIDIDIESLKEWPILDEVRQDPRFAKVIEETEKKRGFTPLPN